MAKKPTERYAAYEARLAALRAENERFRSEIGTEREGREQIREMALAEIARKDVRIAELEAARDRIVKAAAELRVCAEARGFPAFAISLDRVISAAALKGARRC